MRTNIWYDTEFLEDGETIDLISIGMVDDKGNEYYAVNAEANYGRIVKDPWLMENVMSSIDHEVVEVNGEPVTLYVTDPALKNKDEIAQDVRSFVVSKVNPVLWASFGAYDHVAYAQLFGKMIHLPTGMPMLTHDINTLRLLANAPRGPEQEDGQHNALADARHNRVRFDFYWSLLTR